jgi:hypothetical protein
VRFPTPRSSPPNVLGVSCAARSRVPKPERRGSCRERRTKNRVATCNCRDAVTLAKKQAARLPGRSRAASASHQS